MPKKVFTKTLIVFILLATSVVAGFIAFLYYRNEVFTKDALQLSISGPETARMGEEITYKLTYKNNGKFVLEKPKLVFYLPDNSLTEDSKTRLAQDLPNINPGQEDFVTFTTRLLGKEGDQKVATTTLSYTPHNLSAQYESDASFSTSIDTVPLVLSYEAPVSVEAGKPFTYTVRYLSNVDYPLENISIRLGATDGFSFISSDPASLDSREYKLPTLLAGDGSTVTITGTATAGAESPLHFTARLGMWVNGSFVVIKEASQDVQVMAPIAPLPLEILPITE